MEEGVPLEVIARASDLPLEVLEQLDVAGKQMPVPTDQELGARAAKLAMQALVEGERILQSGSEATRVRLILGLAQHPMRRMTTDLGEQTERLQAMLERILSGGATLQDELGSEEFEDAMEDEPDGQ